MPSLIGSSLAMIIFLGCAFALLILLNSSSSRPDGQPEPVPAQAEPVARQFLTEREEAMLAAIEQILPGHRIHAQVSMGALLRAPRRDGRKASAADRNSFSQKIVDFVVQDRLSGSVVALVEVDDSSHVARRDQERDAMTQRAGRDAVAGLLALSRRPTAIFGFNDLVALGLMSALRRQGIEPGRAKPALPDVRLALAPLLQSRTSISAAEDRQAGDA